MREEADTSLNYFCCSCILYVCSNLSSQVKDFLGRFDNIPDILELDHLTVAGDVTFGRSVTLKVRKVRYTKDVCTSK